MTFNIAKLQNLEVFNINKLQPEAIAVDYTQGQYVVYLNGEKFAFDDFGSAKELIENSVTA